ncbi:MAG: hypothetical protein IKQ08_11445 [Paludibacteraceae bacterium]|nr:hypothetical protein [Paludibacteraceae bacterium]
METIISALITGVTAIIVGVVQNSKTRALIEYRLLELEKKQDKHNDVINRMFIAEKDIAVNTEQIKVANHRIDDLEELTKKEK